MGMIAKAAPPDPILRIEGVSRNFPVGRRLFGRSRAVVRALDNVNLVLGRGETLGLVGESGCGKSTLGRLVVALDRPSAGRILIDAQPLSDLPPAALHATRRRVQMIFQDPLASLNPRMTLHGSIAEPLRNYLDLSAAALDARVAALARQTGLDAHLLDRLPHEVSGGQCQRAGIARAIALDPDVIVADEPVSALDVSIQAQILNLLVEIGRRRSLSMIFVSHDLSVVRHIADRVAVMYLGRIVEAGPTAAVFAGPRHPYTRMLLSSVPRAVPAARRARPTARGELPSPVDPPSGCHFRTRCPRAAPRCAAEVPRLLPQEGAIDCACHLPHGPQEGIAHD